MPTPAECVYKYRRLSNEDFAIWYGNTLGVKPEVSVLTAQHRLRKSIQIAIDALVPAPVEEIVEEAVQATLAAAHQAQSQHEKTMIATRGKTANAWQCEQTQKKTRPRL